MTEDGEEEKENPIPATFRIIVFVHSHRCSQWSSRCYASKGRGWLTPGLPAEAAADTRSPDGMPRWGLLGKTWKFMLTHKRLPKMVRPDWLDGWKSGEQCSRTLATKRHSSSFVHTDFNEITASALILREGETLSSLFFIDRINVIEHVRFMISMQ